MDHIDPEFDAMMKQIEAEEASLIAALKADIRALPEDYTHADYLALFAKHGFMYDYTEELVEGDYFDLKRRAFDAADEKMKEFLRHMQYDDTEKQVVDNLKERGIPRDEIQYYTYHYHCTPPETRFLDDRWGVSVRHKGREIGDFLTGLS